MKQAYVGLVRRTDLMESKVCEILNPRLLSRRNQNPRALSLSLSLKAAPLVRVRVKFTVKTLHAWSGAPVYGEFDCEFDFDSHEWSCSHASHHSV